MNAFTFRDQIVRNYEKFSRSFVRIAAGDILRAVDDEYAKCRYWPEPLIQINPNYKPGATTRELAEAAVLHPVTARIFQVTDKKTGELIPLRLHTHQQDAFALAKANRSYVVTTVTGSGKSLAFFIPIVDHILKAREQDATPRTRAIVIYPMNALANSQADEIGKFLKNLGAEENRLTFARYTGQESQAERTRLSADPPDILLTNFMMLELILRFVLGYRLLRDLRKGWRFNNPNLRQLDLLDIDFRNMADMAYSQSASLWRIKRGIEQTFQIESAELVVEALPLPADRRALLLYEAAEGGAGVLSRLATDPSQMAQVARSALSLMHYEVPDGVVSPANLKDLAGAAAGPGAVPCEAGCYQCLLSYFNQPDHEIIDRRNTEAVTSYAQDRGFTLVAFPPDTAAWADTLLEDSLSGAEHPLAARCAATVTHAVDVVTSIFVLRLRHQLTSRRRDVTRTLMAEECVTLAVAGRANPQWLTDADLSPLLAAEPAANLTEAAAADHIQTTLDFLKSQTPYLENLATERANALLTDHRRVREAARDVGSYEVTPCLPVDVLGVYVLLPASL
jgi:hypothetical protein